MNIAYLLDGFGIGGTELNATRTLEALARRGILTTVVHYAEDGPLRSRVAAAGHRLVHVRTHSLYSPRSAATLLQLRRVFRDHEISLVHAQDIYSNILGVLAGRMLCRLPVITSRRWAHAVPRPVLLPINAWAHRQSSLILPNSSALTAMLLAEGVPQSRIIVHENFIDDEAIHRMRPADVAAWRLRLGISPNALTVGCVARLSPVKRHDILLAGFQRVTTEVPDAVLILVGDGPARRELEAQAEALGLRGRVIFCGTLPHTPLSQQLFDVAVLVSENEGFPNSLVEASACGVPLVATLVGGVRDVLVENQTGYAVPVGDTHALAVAVLRLLRDPAERERLGARGRALVIDRFGESAAIDRLLAIYRRFGSPTTASATLTPRRNHRE